MSVLPHKRLRGSTLDPPNPIHRICASSVCVATHTACAGFTPRPHDENIAHGFTFLSFKKVASQFFVKRSATKI